MLLMSFIAFDIVLLFPKERDLYTREARRGYMVHQHSSKMLSRTTRPFDGRRRLCHHRLLDDGLPEQRR